VKQTVSIILLAGLFGCHTFIKMKPDYAELPVDSLREVAREIEQTVYDGNREFSIADRDGIVVNTDVIQQAIRTRAARAHLVAAFLETGHTWEKSNGLIEVLRTREYKKFGSSRDRDRNALVVLGENTDRWAIYEGIVDAGNFPSRSLGAVQRIFFEARLEFLANGVKYESETGEVAFIGGSPATR
jgi:hypothetical protein